MKYATRKMKQMILFPEMNNGKEYVLEDVKFPLAGHRVTKKVKKPLLEQKLFM